MNAKDVMAELKALGNDRTRATLLRHGAPENLYGVRIGDMQPIVKRVKKDQALAEELFATGNGDAMYLAGLIADPDVVRPAVLKRWAKASKWSMIGEYIVAGVAADSPHGWKLGLEWIEAKSAEVACTGWCTLSGVVATAPDDQLDRRKIKTLLNRCKRRLSQEPDRVRYTMNGFVIAVGCYVAPLSEQAREIAEDIGKVEVDMGDTACKVPHAPAYIDKVVKAGRLGKKRKSARC